ncbi:hypothetical protein EVAR_75509_1 [Eumeta japonica]|uniref:Uncharacterized protein n=1 Tax=Eumeta variegata TaxID=151549 RepID=A0A4C1UJU9_EUMVA|nr:hypothetical protein EVAR_75509_1 [Eumeta japonica]
MQQASARYTKSIMMEFTVTRLPEHARRQHARAHIRVRNDRSRVKGLCVITRKRSGNEDPRRPTPDSFEGGGAPPPAPRPRAPANFHHKALELNGHTSESRELPRRFTFDLTRKSDVTSIRGDRRNDLVLERPLEKI